MTPVRRFLVTVAFALVLCGAVVKPAGAQNLNYHHGPTMQNPIKVFLIYWLPPGVVFDNTVANGVGNFETLTQAFFTDVSGSGYFNILTQYPGICGLTPCVVQNARPAVQLAGTWVDARPYPHAGTQSDPLQDADIQSEVGRAISQNNWQVDPNTAFFVYTGAGIEECTPSGTCTFGGLQSFCGYHDFFGRFGNTVLYSYLSDASFNSAGCDEGTFVPVNGQLASDREVALQSHEFFEMITDPVLNGWWAASLDEEIGDKCNQKPATLNLNGGNFVVQQQWSNATSSCVAGFQQPAVVGMSVFECTQFCPSLANCYGVGVLTTNDFCFNGVASDTLLRVAPLTSPTSTGGTPVFRCNQFCPALSNCYGVGVLTTQRSFCFQNDATDTGLRVAPGAPIASAPGQTPVFRCNQPASSLLHGYGIGVLTTRREFCTNQNAADTGLRVQ
jgi:hypothetical protein